MKWKWLLWIGMVLTITGALLLFRGHFWAVVPVAAGLCCAIFGLVDRW
jgi:hypothetical protein